MPHLRPCVRQLRKLEAKRAQSTALLEHANELARLLSTEESEARSGAHAAERAAEEADAARERQRATDAVHAMRVQIEALREENERLASERAHLQAERDEAALAREAEQAGLDGKEL